MRSFHYFFLGATCLLASVTSADDFLYCDLFNGRIDLIEKAPIIPPQGCRPEDGSPDECIKSAPNTNGDILISFSRGDIKEFSVSLRTKEGKMRYLYQRNGSGKQPLVAPITRKLLWLSDHTFACVGSGRANSYYAVYGLESSNDADPVEARTITCGVVHFRVEWKVNNGNLEAWGWGKFLHISIAGSDSTR